ncbi:MAG: hypothetical protein UMR38_06130 [Candidatus Izemoplasma sp.]|nr:hypothetical protein [Candidatus Izemoplasma sp.]
MGILALIGTILLFLVASYTFQTIFDKSHDHIEEVSTPTIKDIGIGVLKLLGLLLLFWAFNYFVLFKFNLRYLAIIIYGVAFVILGLQLTYRDFNLAHDYVVKASSALFGLVVILSIFVYGLFGGRVFLHSEAYSELLHVDEKVFDDDVQTVDVNTLPIVDKSYGVKLGSLKLGEYPGIGSEFEPGAYSDIIYQGEQYLVSPLEYRGIFKWLNNNNEGTPGYILINKVTSETTLVNLSATEDIGLKYTPSAFFEQDLKRHAYMNGLNKYRFEQSYFEIDESGHPYYILQYSLPTIFLNGGDDIAKIAVVDAVTGDVDIYDPDDVPDWVESVYPPGLLLQHLDYWGTLQDGWLNSFLAQRGVLKSSDGKRTIKNNNGLYYFTGLTSAGSDESTIGFVYMNVKTKEATLYQFPGATEYAAMSKTLTLIPQNNISTSFPIPINVNGSPTYYILIKGEDGRIIRHVFMNVTDLETYGIAEKKTNAYSDYLLNLGISNQTNLTNITGEITDVTSYVNEGNTIYWVQIDNDVYYVINVSTFSFDKMRYFIEKDIGDTITIEVQDFTVIDMGDSN